MRAEVRLWLLAHLPVPPRWPLVTQDTADLRASHAFWDGVTAGRIAERSGSDVLGFTLPPR